MENIQHSTPNIQHPMRSVGGSWRLGARGWMLKVPRDSWGEIFPMHTSRIEPLNRKKAQRFGRTKRFSPALIFVRPKSLGRFMGSSDDSKIAHCAHEPVAILGAPASLPASFLTHSATRRQDAGAPSSGSSGGWRRPG